MDSISMALMTKAQPASDVGALDTRPPSDKAEDPTRLTAAAQEFEAMLIYSLLKSMDETSGEGGWAGANGMGDWGLQAVSTAIAESGGFGLAERVVEQLRQTESQVSELPSVEGHPAVTTDGNL